MEEVEVAKKRCREAVERIGNLTNINQSNKSTLLKLAQSELSFLSRFSSSSSSSSNLLSVNIGHLEAVLHLLRQPFIKGVSRVCKPLPLHKSKGLYVDIVCTLNSDPVWIIVSDRNPNYITWETTLNHKQKGLKFRVQQLLNAARSAHTLKPSSIVLFFSNGLTNFVHHKLKHEFGAFDFGFEFSDHFNFDFCVDLEGEWVKVLVARSFRDGCALQIQVVDCGNKAAASSPASETVSDLLFMNAVSAGTLLQEHECAKVTVNSPDAFSSLLSRMNKFSSLSVENVKAARTNHLLGEGNLINFDTTALIALVSGISNGDVDKLLATPESQLRRRFKGNFEFVMGQVMSEIQNPMLEEMAGVIAGKKGIICESVCAEFKELVSICGGPNEKLRAEQLLKCLTVVLDRPSERMIGLPTTRKLAMKNKIVFGTGDCWHTPTLTANMSFVRAVSQTGMSLFTIEHRPRALTGD